MESVTYLEQEIAAPASLWMQLLLQALKVLLQNFCIPLKFETADTGEEREMTLREAAMSGNLTAVQLLLKAGVAPTERDKEHYTPLHWAAAKGHTEVVRKLIEVGAGLEGRGGRFHFTPLHMAAGEGHLETSRLLLDAGAEVDAIDRFHDTPMHWAAWFGHLSVVQLLVERGGDSAAKNKDGNTPRDMAFVKRNEHVVQWFRELQGVMLDRRDILNSSEFPHTLR